MMERIAACVRDAGEPAAPGGGPSLKVRQTDTSSASLTAVAGAAITVSGTNQGRRS
jgi:hypothetical protein